MIHSKTGWTRTKGNGMIGSAIGPNLHCNSEPDVSPIYIRFRHRQPITSTECLSRDHIDQVGCRSSKCHTCKPFVSQGHKV